MEISIFLIYLQKYLILIMKFNFDYERWPFYFRQIRHYP